MCPSSSETWEWKNELRVEATKKLRLVCKNWYKSLDWNELFLKNEVSLKVVCHHKTSENSYLRLVSDETDDEQLFQDESMFLVTMCFTQEKLEKWKIPLSPNCLVIEHGFQLPSSQFNLQRVCKLVMDKDQAPSYRCDIIVGQLMDLLQSIAPESLKILILNRMHITNEILLFLSSRFSKLEYLALPNCTIDNQNIYWKFSSLKILILTFPAFSSELNNIVLHYLDNETNRRLTFDDRMCNFM
jgi:hypothetical protein